MPGRLRRHDIGNGHHSFLEADVRAAEILFGSLHVLVGRGQLLVGVLETETVLLYFQIDLFSGVFQFEPCNARGGLAGTYLVSVLSPRPYRNLYGHADVPEIGETLLESVEEIGIRQGIAAREQYVGKVERADELGVLPAEVDCILKQTEFGTALDGVRMGRGRALPGVILGRRGGRNVGVSFVRESDIAVQLQTAQLAQSHLRQ